mmetsp:Transcript_63850/g.144044  ORF Transcript_63850/g.144044 Transcript_63850/m.144044 type:complete len:204 (+) Transcript_63850:2253-2864(+)
MSRFRKENELSILLNIGGHLIAQLKPMLTAIWPKDVKDLSLTWAFCKSARNLAALLEGLMVVTVLTLSELFVVTVVLVLIVNTGVETLRADDLVSSGSSFSVWEMKDTLPFEFTCTRSLIASNLSYNSREILLLIRRSRTSAARSRAFFTASLPQPATSHVAYPSPKSMMMETMQMVGDVKMWYRCVPECELVAPLQGTQISF